MNDKHKILSLLKFLPAVITLVAVLIVIISINFKPGKSDNIDVIAEAYTEYETMYTEAETESAMPVTEEETTEETTEEATVIEETTAVEETIPETTTEYVPPAPVLPDELLALAEAGRAAYIDNFPCINQNPDLPTGCEVTSLTMVLNYLGYDADKNDLAENYLTKEEFPYANPYYQFVGDPSTSDSFGCYAPVITECALKYGVNATNISYSSMDTICSYIEEGQPVIIWATVDMVPTKFGSTVWTDADGETVSWRGREHCVVMVGFDAAANEVYLADPMNGYITTYRFSTFYTRWQEQGCQAVIVNA